MKTDICKALHLLTTPLCDRDCKFCCNKQFNLETVPFVTKSELNTVRHVYLTGGEPFAYSNPNAIARYLKTKYKNITRVCVYTNAKELSDYLFGIGTGSSLNHIDTVTISIKDTYDLIRFNRSIAPMKDYIPALQNAWVYVFDQLYPDDLNSFIIKDRVWQEQFEPHPNCIFRRL